LENHEYDWYILFPNHHQGLRLNRELKEQGIKNTIAPTPREASTSCGMSLIVGEADLESIMAVIEAKSIVVEKIVKLARKEWQYRSC